MCICWLLLFLWCLDFNSRDSKHATSDKAKKKRTDKKEPTDYEAVPQFIDMYSSIYAMRQDLERVRKPVGSKDNPGRTCKDIFYGHPQFTNG